MQQPKPQSKRRGFNLIEVAITLGIVGLIVGGIWSAAAAVAKEQKLNQTVLGIIHIATETQKTITLSAGAAMGCCPSITGLMIATAGVPAGWSTNAARTQYIPPIGKTAGAANFGNRMDFVFDNAGQDECIRLIKAITTALKGTGSTALQGITVYTGSYGGTATLSTNASSWPIIPTTAQCINGVNTINFITSWIYN